MIPKTDFFDQIEDYCIEQLEEESKQEFEAELKKNPKLRSELELWMEIQTALVEKDVLTLRNKLENVAPQRKPANSGNESFEFLNDVNNMQELVDILSSEELINYYDSLPKVHVYHHESSPSENIHAFYKEQEVKGISGSDEGLDDFDMSIFEGLEEAILEKDVLHLRQTLKQVAKSVEPQFSAEEIDGYLTGELSGTDLLDFEKNMFQSSSLRGEVQLHRQINLAVNEGDIMALRSQLSKILQTETSWNVSDKSIEEYIDGNLDDDLLAEFELELNDNTDLIAEVKLRKQINDSLKEKDIFDLRKALVAAKEKAEVKKMKMIIPETKKANLKFWRSSVAIFIVLLGLAGVLRNNNVAVDKVYDNYFAAPSWSPERSLSSEITLLQQANISYLNADYTEALRILNQAASSDMENPVINFYKAASFQGMSKYEDAIGEYSKVIKHGDNLFIEEAEWFRSLCYMKLEDYEKMRIELLAVMERKGHYENNAKAIIRRLKYTSK
jgi:anti-sigma factor RsiW